MVNYGMKYGLQGIHYPRCNCVDCTRMFLEHNRNTFCQCVDCVGHREINTAPPRITTPEEHKNALDAARRSTELQWMQYDEPKPQPKGSKKMGNLNICEREGCNAITKGNAAAFIEVTINGNASSVSMSLCPACMTEVDHMLHTAPIIERARSYDKPYTGWKEPVSDDLAAMTTEQLAAELFQRTMKQAQQAIESGK